jgi:hypothetical protein
MKTRIPLAAIGLMLFLPTLGRSESLAEIARKAAEARERREGADKPGKVYGAEDLEGERARRKRETSASPSSPDSEADKRDEAAASEAQDAAEIERQLDRERQKRAAAEVEWRRRVNGANQRLEDARQRYDAVKDVNLHRGQTLVDENGKVVASSPEEFQPLVQEARAELDAAQQVLDDLLESARRAAVPPGWLR